MTSSVTVHTYLASKVEEDLVRSLYNNESLRDKIKEIYPQWCDGKTSSVTCLFINPGLGGVATYRDAVSKISKALDSSIVFAAVDLDGDTERTERQLESILPVLTDAPGGFLLFDGLENCSQEDQAVIVSCLNQNKINKLPVAMGLKGLPGSDANIDPSLLGRFNFVYASGFENDKQIPLSSALRERMDKKAIETQGSVQKETKMNP